MDTSIPWVLVGLTLAAALAPGCLDTTAEGCGGSGEELANVTGTLTPEDETMAIPVSLGANASGLVAAFSWDPDQAEDGELGLRLAGEVDTSGGVHKSDLETGCRRWSGLAPGDYTVEVFYYEESHEMPAPYGPATAPPVAVDVTAIVQPAV